MRASLLNGRTKVFVWREDRGAASGTARVEPGLVLDDERHAEVMGVEGYAAPKGRGGRIGGV